MSIVIIFIVIGPSRDRVDLPDLASEGDDVGGVLDDLDRGRLVQTLYDDSESPIRVNLQQCARIRLRGSTLKWTIPEAVCEGVECVSAAKFHIDEQPDFVQPGAGCHLRGSGRLQGE